jgi:hypothetical protein
MLLVPIGMRFWLQSSNKVIKRYSISTAIEILFLVHCVLGDVDVNLPCSLYSLDFDKISHTGDPLWPGDLLVLALLWPLSNRLIISSFVSKVIMLRFFLSDFTDISLFLLGIVNFYIILIITWREMQ